MGSYMSKPKLSPNPNHQIPPNEENVENEGPWSEVFENPKLLRRIIEQILQIREGPTPHWLYKQLPLAEARALRLVSRSWTKTTNEVFLEAKKPLLFLGDWCPPPGYDEKIGKFMEDFEAFYGREKNNWQPPPMSFSLALEVEDKTQPQLKYRAILPFWPFTRDSPKQSIVEQDHRLLKRLVDMLNNCGSPLVQLKILAPEQDLTVIPTMDLLDLLPLSSVESVVASPYPFSIFEYETFEPSKSIDRPRFAELCQVILDRCNNIKQYSIEDTDMGTTSLDGLNLPGTLTCLGTVYYPELGMAPHVFENLAILKLFYGADEHMGAENISKILSYCGSLQQLYLTNDSRNATLDLASLPTLRKLRILSFQDLLRGLSSWTWAPQSTVNIGHQFPSLEKLTMNCLEGGVTEFVNGWCNFKTPCESMRDVKLHFLNDKRVPVPPSAITRMSTVFPHVTSMMLLLNEDSRILRHVFEEMTQLVTLSIHFSRMSKEASNDEWDAVLIGTTVPIVEQLKNGRMSFAKFLENAAEPQLPGGDEYAPSIRNMKALKALTLSGYYVDFSKPAVGLLPSPLAFDLGFLEAPQLRTLYLLGNFSPTEEDVCRWEREGRVIQTDADKYFIESFM